LVTKRAAAAVGAALLLAASGSNSVAETSFEQRQADKCAHYRRAYAFAITREGKAGLGKEFLERHDAFLASGCTAPPDVCARSPEEIKLVNLLVVLGMNEGMASTFFPFRCPR
jgi:hypothetical protein